MTSQTSSDNDGAQTRFMICIGEKRYLKVADVACADCGGLLQNSMWLMPLHSAWLCEAVPSKRGWACSCGLPQAQHL